LANQQIDEDTTRATARLPGSDIEIVHRRPTDNVEQISIKLRAVPSFDAFGQFLETASPLGFWLRAAEMAWFPWSGVAQMMLLPWTRALAPRQLITSGSNCSSGEDNA
jgi:hypothetical protein